MDFNFDYFKKEDLESFNFFRVPKALFTKDILSHWAWKKRFFTQHFLIEFHYRKKIRG